MQRKNMMVLMISLSLVLLLGSSYALLRSTQVGTTPYVINVGTLQVTFDSGKTEKLSLENMYPMSDKEGISQADELSFTVKNTGTVASYYDVYLEEISTTPEFKSVIRFISNKNNQGYNEPKTLGEDKYIDVGGYLEPNGSSSYKVKVWLDYNADNTYMDKTFTAKVVVNSFQENKYAKDVIKSKLVKYSESSKEDFTGGLIAVNTEGELYDETDETQNIREYRYSGPTVNNYLTFNDEMWRIIGIFKDETGSESLKIVRNNILTGDMFPVFYIINSTTYQIKSDDDYAYWNNNRSGYTNDWSKAGLQYFLNTEQDSDGENKGYLNTLKNENISMIKNTKYYLGTVSNESNFVIDTPKQAYKNERATESCYRGVGPDTNNSKSEIEANENCRVWSGNPVSWRGLVGLMYPSDYGYSAKKIYWDTSLNKDYFVGLPANSSWLYTTAYSSNEWFLSPVVTDSNIISGRFQAFVRTDGIGGSNFVRPTLYLKSNVKITSGNGTSENPYQLEI